MVTKRKAIGLLLVLTLILSAMPSVCLASNDGWEEPGNSALNILNGGVMLTEDGDFWYSAKGIYHETESGIALLTSEDGKNLNRCGDYIYYTLETGVVRRIPAAGGKPETVYDFGAEIKQMYVLGGESLRFLAGGRAYAYDLSAKKLARLSSLEGVMGLIPTEYGNIFLTGEVFNYTVYAEKTPALSGVTSAYTDGGYLVVSIGNADYQAELGSLFSGFDPDADLEPFDLHGDVVLAELFGSVDETWEGDTTSAKDDFYAALMENSGVSLLEGEGLLTPEVSQGQLNMVKRARQLHELKWTPLEDRYQWGYRGTFSAGEAISGLPYGQPVNSAGYVGFNVSLEKFKEATNDNTSPFYTTYSYYNKIAPTYSTDCSGFVSYAWGLTSRKTTYTWSTVATLVSDQSIYSLQVGDALNHSTSHIVFVSDVRYDAGGNIVQVTIMEQTPVKTKLTVYGEGGSYPLARIQSYYLSGGYAVYRYDSRDSVTYTASSAVYLEGDDITACKAEVPRPVVTSAVGQKTLTLTSEYADAAIYYTTDGAAPTAASARYTGPLTFYATTTVKAIAVTASFNNSYALTYKLSIPPVETPTAAVTSGLSSGEYVSSGSCVTLSTATPGAALYYTTDGSTPTAASAKYTSPIAVTQDTTLKVLGQAPGCTDSAVAAFSYKIGQTYTITASSGAGGSVSPSGSATVIQTGSATYAIKASAGYAISDVLVDGVSVGRVTSYTFSNISGSHTISASFVVSTTIPFTDVSSGAWYYNAVCRVYAVGLFAGTGSASFSPDWTMTRGMFITVLGRLAGEQEFTGGAAILTGDAVNIRKEPNTSCDILGKTHKYQVVKVLGSASSGGYTWYQVQAGSVTGYIRGDYLKVYAGGLTDLANGMYYTGYVQWAYLAGLLDGMATSQISADAAITREEMALLLYNYMVKYGVSLPSLRDKEAFTDDSGISSAQKRTAVYALQQAGVINGCGDGTYQPRASAARSQVAQIFTNFLDVKG